MLVTFKMTRIRWITIINSIRSPQTHIYDCRALSYQQIRHMQMSNNDVRNRKQKNMCVALRHIHIHKFLYYMFEREFRICASVCNRTCVIASYVGESFEPADLPLIVSVALRLFHRAVSFRRVRGVSRKPCSSHRKM